MIDRRTALSTIAATCLLGSRQAQAQGADRIVFGYTAVTDFASVFVAKELGQFRKRGLDVDLKLIPLGPTIPPALQSGSLTIGGLTPSGFLQAVDGGLDLVVVAGGAVTSTKALASALMARNGSGIKTARDCIGRKIGVPGLGGYLHVTFRAWLKNEGADWRSVNFVEAAFPQHADLLRGGSVDAVVTGDPFITRITEAGAGYVVSYYDAFMGDGKLAIVQVARRDWAQRNTQAARSFHASLVEAADFMKQPGNDAQVRDTVGRYIKLPPEVLAKTHILPPGPVVTEGMLTYWVDMMAEQRMLKSKIDVRQLIVT